MKRFLYLFLFSISTNLVIGQDLPSQENELVLLLDNLRNAKNKSAKNEANKIFKAQLEKTIQEPGAFDYPFSKLTTLGSIKSPDNSLRLFNWNVEQDDMTQKYYCYILHFNERKKVYELSELIDNSFMIPARPTEILEGKDWYGALYFKIIPVDKGSKTIYTLLGWDGNNTMSNIKLMDVLYFAGNSPRLGSPIFKHQGETLKRVFFEHSEKTTMYLNYDEQQGRIILDHLSPETPSMKGIYSFYVPDLSYDAYELKNNKWYLKEDVIGVNGKSKEKVTMSYYDEKSGEIKSKEIKNKWIDPSDEGSPAGGNKHIATMPEQEDGVNDPNVKVKKQAKQKDRKQPGSYNPVDSKKKKRKR